MVKLLWDIHFLGRPLRYTKNAHPNDPASRLVILADIEPGDGNGRFHRLEPESDMAPLKMNPTVARKLLS